SPAARGVVVGPAGGNLIAGGGAILTIDGPLSGSGNLSIGTTNFFTVANPNSQNSTINFSTSAGVGLVELAGDTSQFTGGVSVLAGTLQLAPGTGTHTVSSLQINPGAFVDLTQSNSLIINYGSKAEDPASTIRSDLTNRMIWTTSTSSAGPLEVGYADGNTDSGTPAGPNQIYLRTTLAGDANLDGTVNFADLLAVAQNFNHPLGMNGNPIDWADGDFNYDGVVNFADLLLVAQNFNKSLSAGQLAQLPTSFAADWQLAQAEVQAGESNNVPEPATIGLLAVGATGLLARRRRANRR
ncbi:MAG: dockerin type I domain-containing protein, partial [Tepidisphaeraceae bacterium]